MGTRPLVVAVLLSTACSGRVSSTPAPDAAEEWTYRSGTRLRAHFFDAGEGATMLIDWRDTMFNVSCRFYADEMGITRCLPNSWPSTIATWSFVDSACTQPALITSAPDSLPPYVGVAVSESCLDERASFRPYAVAAEAPASATAYHYEALDKTCSPVSLAQGEHFLPLNAVDPTIFVSATAALEIHGGGVYSEILVADDNGTREFSRAWDQARNTTCTILRTGSNETTGWSCVASAVGSDDSGFSDDTCTTPARGRLKCSSRFCGLAAFSVSPRPPDVNCVTTYEVHALATETTALYRSSGQCNLDPSCMLYPETVSIEPSALPALQSGTLGSGRVKKLVFRAPADGRVALDRDGFWDGARNAKCGVDRFTDQVFRCVTEDIPRIVFAAFGDASCTQPLTGIDDCGNAPPFVTEVDQSEPSFATRRVFAVGAPFEGTTMYWSTAPGACEPVPNEPPGHWRVVGPELDPDTVFPRVAERTDLPVMN